jgi:hypothetical protein
MLKRSARFAASIVIGFAICGVIAFVLIMSITRSEWGMQRVRGIALGWLKDRVQGEVRIGRISGGGLLHGAILHDVSIVGTNKRKFFSVDSAEISYDWRTLLRGDIRMDHVRLYQPNVHLEELPGDTAWNYQYIFQDTTPGRLTPKERKLIMFDDLHVINGSATVLYPLPPVTSPADTARLLTERFGRDLGRVMHFDNLQGRVTRALWESPIEPGRMFEIGDVNGLAFVYKQPVKITGARGRLTMRDSVVTLDFPDVRLPSSHGAVMGRVVMNRGRNVFDIQLDLDNFAFRDMDWLYDKLPAQGGGRGRMRIQTLRRGTLFLAENARLATPGTNVAGSFGIVVGDTTYFTKVDLRASPLDINVIKRMMPNGLPIDGLMMGTVEVKGPLSALEMKGDMKLASKGNTSAVVFAGTVDARNRTIGRNGIKAQVRDFDLGLIHALQPRFTLAGRITGNVDAIPDAGNIRIAADIEHRNGSGAPSSLTGGGLLTGPPGARALEMDWTARYISLDELAVQYPALRGLSGSVSGPLHIAGPLTDLTYRTELLTAGGTLDITGWLRRSGAEPRYGGEGRTSSFALDRFDKRLPTGTVSGRFAFDLGGTAMANANGTVRLDVDSARFGPVPVQHSIVSAHMGDGMLHVDSMVATTPAGDIVGGGSFGLVGGKSGTLQLSMLSESLSGLEADLFGSKSDAAEAPRLAGSIRASASIDGSIFGANVIGTAALRDVVVGPLRARGATLSLNGRMMDSAGTSMHAVAHADTLTGYRHTFRVADLSYDGAGDTAGVSLTGGDADVKRVTLHGHLLRNEQVQSFRLADLTLGGEDPWSLVAPATLSWAHNRLHVDQLTLQSSDSVSNADVVGDLMWNDTIAPMDFHFGLHSVDVGEFLRLAHSDLPGSGNIEGSVHVTGTAANPLLDSDMSVSDLRYGDLRLDRLASTVKYRNQDIETFFDARQKDRRVLSGGGHTPFDLRFRQVAERKLDRPLAMTFTADSLPLALPLGALPGFTDIAGRVDGTVAFNGTTLDPALSGSLDVRDGAATWDASGVHYYGVNGTAKLISDRVVDVLATGRGGVMRRNGRFAGAATDGNAAVSGRLDFTTLTDPGFALKMTATNLLAAKRREADITMSGDMQLNGRYSRPEVTGNVTVEEGSLYLDEVYRRYLVVELDPNLLFNVVDTSLVSVRRVLPVSDNPFLKNLLISNVGVHVNARDAWLRSRDLEVLVGGDLTVAFDRRDADLRMTGSLGVIRGTYNLAYPPLQARRFQVREGTIEFPGTPGIDPNLTITAAYRAPTRNEPLDVIASVTGTLQTPRVRLTSDAQPPISESDLASYLFFGVPSWEVATFGNGSAGLGADLGLRTFAPSVLGYAASGLQTLTQRFGLFDYVGISAADTETGQVALNNAFANFFASTQIDVGRVFFNDVYFGITKRMNNSFPGARIEWRYSPTYTAQIFVEDRFANTPSFGLQREVGFKRVAGFFLFREWGY